MDELDPQANPGALAAAQAAVGGAPAASGEKVIERDRPDVPKDVEALVKDWLEKVEEAKTYWKPAFDDMKRDAKFAAGKQWVDQIQNDDRYRANITLRHINQRVASIYAKNPRVRAVRKPKIYAETWDGSTEMVEEAIKAIAAEQNPEGAAQAAAAGLAPPPVMDAETAKKVIQEAQECATSKRLYDRMGKTLEIVAQYSLDEPIPKFKTQAKQLVRRVLTCKAGYIKLGYQRVMKYGPDVEARIRDITDKLKEIERIGADIADGEVQKDSAEAATLQASLKDLQNRKDVIVREGLMFSFPKSWNLILDPEVTQLKGFVGAEWIAEEYIYTPKKVEKIYGKDVGTVFNPHTVAGGKGDRRKKDSKFCAVYEIHDLVNQMTFTVCSGYPDFLVEPTAEDITIDQIHPYFALTFNDTENTGENVQESAYPPSDVELMQPMQVEYNRGREGLRVHRIGNRPALVSAAGVFDKETKEKFSSHADNEIIETNLSKSEDVGKALVPKPIVQIQKDLYDVEHVFIDTQRVLGDQAANLGGTSGDTATESSIAENSRATTIQSCIDDLDEFLTDLMRACGQVLLKEMSEETVKKIAGPGAAWPKLTPQEISEELYLEIQAGSSGRPNKGARLQAIEKTMPLLLQIPKLKPEKLAEFVFREIDEGIQVEDFLDESLPSITAMNAQAKPNLSPRADGAATAAAGAANAPAPVESGAKTQNLGGTLPRPPQMPAVA